MKASTLGWGALILGGLASSACSSEKNVDAPLAPATGSGGTGAGSEPPPVAVAGTGGTGTSGGGDTPDPTDLAGSSGGTSGSSAPGSGASGDAGGTGGSTSTDSGVVAAGCPASATATPGETNVTVNVGGQNRSYLLHIPPGYTGDTPLPVVIDFHPLGGTGASQKNLSGWDDVADRENFIVVWPNGIGNSWNVGRCCPPAFEQGVDDVAFVRAILEQLSTQACIDARRVYATGCSNGGGMSYKVACEAADVIAAVAPVDFDCVVGPDNVPSCGGCEPARPISEVQFRATADFAVNYNGGPAPIPQGMDFPGAQQNFADRGEINQCTGEPSPLAGHAACETFPACAGGAETTLCTQQGGSHCGNYGSLDIVNIAWEHFERAALP